LRAALIRQCLDGKPDTISIKPVDLRKKLFKRPGKTLIVFVVDASDSMGQGTFARIKAAKGAALAILTKAHLERHRVAMVAFRDESADVILQPTASLVLAQKNLKELPTGGATPFAHGLMKAMRIVNTERLKDPEIRPLLVIISDGEANVPYEPNLSPTKVMDELFVICRKIGQDNIYSIAIDTKPIMKKTDDMRMIAESLGGTYHHVHHLRARNVVEFISKF
jgi:magnesium chelatase subunit D